MKKYVLAFLIFFGSAFSISAQNIPNPSFDSVYFGGIDRVFEWITSDGILFNNGFSNDTVNNLQPNTCFDASGFQFSELLWNTNQLDSTPYSQFAMQITHRPNLFWQDGSHFESFVISGNRFCSDANGKIDLGKSGVPFSHQPTSLMGYYKFVDSSLVGMNSARCLLLFSRWNAVSKQRDTIAFTEAWLPLNINWQQFYVPLAFSSSPAPDSVSVIFSGTSSPQTKSTLWLDELSFQYVVVGEEEFLLEESQIKFYPNPAQDFIIFEAEESTFSSCKIFSQDGTLLRESPFAQQISVLELPTGFYVIELTDSKYHRQRLKLLIVRN